MAKKIELSTRRGSIRWLNATQLVVNWEGSGNLFYRMTKKVLREVLAGAEIANMRARLWKETSEHIFYGVKRTKTTLSIGCERFNAKDLKLMRKWCGAA